MFTQWIPGVKALNDRIGQAGDAQLTLFLLALAACIALAAFLLPPALKPLAIAYVVFP